VQVHPAPAGATPAQLLLHALDTLRVPGREVSVRSLQQAADFAARLVVPDATQPEPGPPSEISPAADQAEPSPSSNPAPGEPGWSALLHGVPPSKAWLEAHSRVAEQAEHEAQVPDEARAAAAVRRQAAEKPSEPPTDGADPRKPVDRPAKTATSEKKPATDKRASRDKGGRGFHLLHDAAIEEFGRWLKDPTVKHTKRAAVKHLLTWLELQDLPEGVELPEDRAVRTWVSPIWPSHLPDK
jgi:hypothetical protein